jgi:NAD-dependent oxidoreductase involved in siderophore biosynthesis
MKNHLVIASVLLPLLALTQPVAADSPTVTHRVLGQDRGHVAIIGTAGQVEWEAPCPGTAHDIALLPSGNILVQIGARNVVEMTPQKTIAWRYDAKPLPGNNDGVEIHAFEER